VILDETIQPSSSAKTVPSQDAYTDRCFWDRTAARCSVVRLKSL
jgi:hypothetical protein